MPRRNPFAELEALYNDLEEVASRLGYAVIVDTGPFNGGACLLEGEELIVLNKSTPLEQRTRLLAEALACKDLSGIYLKPATRAVLEDYLERGPTLKGMP
ncbi:MAG: hypothetical protein ACETWG_02115 [Candidatus Neomarinimicrobiota bacterium]